MPRPRKRGISFPPLPPPDPIRLAFSGKIDAEAWQEVRVEVWHEWLRLIDTPDEREWERWRAKLWPEGQLDPRCHRSERDPDRPWPPKGVLHDGIEARVLRAYCSPPEGYVNHWGARPTIVEHAEQGLDGPVNARRRRGRAVGLEPITLHECRHTVASLMIAAGENPKGDPDVHGPRHDPDDLRPLRPSNARQPRRGPRSDERLPG